jgi:transcription elongation GreA/GreB family factor
LQSSIDFTHEYKMYFDAKLIAQRFFASVSMNRTSTLEHWITAHWRDHLLQMAHNHPNADDIRHRLATAVVVAPDDILPGRVQFGALITVFSLEEEEEQTFQIVSRDQAQIGCGLLDQSSPLAQAILGAREGEVVNVVLANGSQCPYEITHIRTPQT